MAMAKGRNTLRQKFVATAALFVVSSIIITGLSANILSALWTQVATRQPERYMSLAFLNTGHLHTYAGAGVPQHITFRLTSHETSVATYHYRALLSTGATATLLREGSATLHEGQYTDQTLTFMLPSPNMTAHLTVQLVDRAESLNFGLKS
jgi:hypothetical protein